MLDRAQRGWSTSKRYWLWLLSVQAGAALIATGAAWARPERGLVAVALPVLGVMIPLGARYLRSRADRAFTAAEAWRRIHLLKDGLDYEPTASEYSAFALDAPTRGRNDQQRGTTPYFASKLPPGYPRLMENLGESAFHTCGGAEAMASLCGAGLVVSALVCVCALLVALGLPLTLEPNDVSGAASLARAAPRVASITSVVLTLIVTGQAVELLIAYRTLARTARFVMDRALALGRKVPTEGATLNLLGTYEAALAATGLPIFSVGDSAEREREWGEVLARRESGERDDQ